MSIIKSIAQAVVGPAACAPTCCEAHGVSDCDQGRKCPGRCPVYSVRVIRPGHQPVEYETRAAGTFDAIDAAHSEFGLAGFFSAKRVKP